MYQVLYIVHIGNDEIEFETEQEALEYATEHEAECPSVEAVELLLNDFGEVEGIADSEIIFSCDKEQPEECQANIMCSCCGQEVPQAACKNEQTLGWICPECEESLKARDEKMLFVEAVETAQLPSIEELQACDTEVSFFIDKEPRDCFFKGYFYVSFYGEDHSYDFKASMDVKILSASEATRWEPAAEMEIDSIDVKEDMVLNRVDDQPINIPVTKELFNYVTSFIDTDEAMDDLYLNISSFLESKYDLYENVNINVSADSADEILDLARALLGDDYDAFDQDFPQEDEPEECECCADKPCEECEENIPEAESEEDEEEPEEDEEEVESDSQPMDMIDGKLVPAKNPEQAEVEIEESFEEEEEMTDLEFAEALEKAVKECKAAKTAETMLTEAAFTTKVSNFFKDLKNKTENGFSKDSINKVFKTFTAVAYKSDDSRTKKEFTGKASSYSDALAWCQSASAQPEISEIKLYASELTEDAAALINKATSQIKLPFLIKTFMDSKCIKDNSDELQNSIINILREVGHEGTDAGTDKPVEVKIVKAPDKVEYAPGEKFDFSGLKLEIVYADGETRETSKYDAIYPESSTTIGKQKVRIKYGKDKVEQEVTIYDPEKKARWWEDDTTTPSEETLAQMRADREKSQQYYQAKAAEKSTAAAAPAEQPQKATKGANNAKIKKALEDAGFDVNDLFSEDEDGNQKATEKLVSLRKALFGESFTVTNDKALDAVKDDFTPPAAAEEELEEPIKLTELLSTPDERQLYNILSKYSKEEIDIMIRNVEDEIEKWHSINKK